MPYNSPHHLSEIRRTDPRKLVDVGDSGIERQNGDAVDLHALLTKNSVQVRLVRVMTNSMRASGLHQGGIAIVDRSIPLKAGLIIHVRYNGEELMRRLIKRAGQWWLVADDPRIGELLITDEDIVERLGVVTAGIMFTETVK